MQSCNIISFRNPSPNPWLVWNFFHSNWLFFSWYEIQLHRRLQFLCLHLTPICTHVIPLTHSWASNCTLFLSGRLFGVIESWYLISLSSSQLPIQMAVLFSFHLGLLADRIPGRNLSHHREDSFHVRKPFSVLFWDPLYGTLLAHWAYRLYLTLVSLLHL